METRGLYFHHPPNDSGYTLNLENVEKLWSRPTLVNDAGKGLGNGWALIMTEERSIMRSSRTQVTGDLRNKLETAHIDPSFNKLEDKENTD